MKKFFLFLFVGSFVVTNFSLPGLAPASPSMPHRQVAEEETGRQEKYEFVLQWGSRGSGEGEFLCPEGIAVDSSGNVYVVDYSNHRIQKFTK